VYLLIVIGAREDGEKELLAIEDGYCESTESSAAAFRDLKPRRLNEDSGTPSRFAIAAGSERA
jgi:transposase-like protein